MGIQMLAYGGSQGFSFQRVSAESQILEGGITGNFTRDATKAVLGPAGCNSSSIDSAATIACLRNISTHQLLQAQIKTASSGPSANVGDQWLPLVDGDFLPAAPTQLISEGRFAKVTLLSGWCENDGTPFVGNPKTEKDVYDFFRAYLPGFTTANVKKLLSLYPVSDFSPDPSAGLNAQFYRAGRMLRDILFVCQAINFANALNKAGQDVYFWEQNQTVVGEIYAGLGRPGLGVVHTSNFAFQFHNITHYNINNFVYNPNNSDFALADRQSHSWAAFANTGNPSLAPGQRSLLNWTPGYANGDEIDIYVIGGKNQGLSSWTGKNAANPVLVAQKLKERCSFLNSPEILEQLNY